MKSRLAIVAIYFARTSFGISSKTLPPSLPLCLYYLSCACFSSCIPDSFTLSLTLSGFGYQCQSQERERERERESEREREREREEGDFTGRQRMAPSAFVILVIPLHGWSGRFILALSFFLSLPLSPPIVMIITAFCKLVLYGGEEFFFARSFSSRKLSVERSDTKERKKKKMTNVSLSRIAESYMYI